MGVKAPQPAVEAPSVVVALGRPRLVDSTSGETRVLEDGKVTMGRSASCSFKVKDKVVSGQHCVLHIVDGGVQVEDVSSNKTYINGLPISKGHRVTLKNN